MSPSCRPTAGVTALPAGASSARTQNTRTPLRLLGDRGVDGRIVRAGDRVPGAVEVAVAVGGGRSSAAPRRGHALDGGRDLRRDHLHVRTRREEPDEPPLRHRAAADDDDPAPGEVETDEVVLGHRSPIGDVTV